MKIHTEKSLANFDFWGGATYTTDKLTFEELEQLDSALSELYPDGIDETHLNDIFAFDADWILQLIGLTEEDIENRD